MSYHSDLYRKALSNSGIYNYTVLKIVSAVRKPGSALSGRTCASTPQCTKSWGGGTRGGGQESHTRGDIIRKLKTCKGPGSGSSVQRRLMSVGRTEKGSGAGWSRGNRSFGGCFSLVRKQTTWVCTSLCPLIPSQACSSLILWPQTSFCLLLFVCIEAVVTQAGLR